MGYPSPTDSIEMSPTVVFRPLSVGTECLPINAQPEEQTAVAIASANATALYMLETLSLI